MNPEKRQHHEMNEFADDQCLLYNLCQGLQAHINILHNSCLKQGTEINIKKSEITAISRIPSVVNVQISH